MSSGLFASKQHKSLRNLKKILILSPLNATNILPLNSPVAQDASDSRQLSTPVVVLKAKYTFQAQAPPELSVNTNDYFRFVDRPGNGWLTVQCIDKNKQGLVPALYVEIVVNDPKQPVTLAWLNEVEAPKYYMDDVKSLRITTVLVDAHKRCWYRMDIRLHNGAHRFVAKTYHDMYQLHIELVEKFAHCTKLPPLPRTLGAVNITEKTHMLEMVAHAAQLDHYLNVVLEMHSIAHSDTFSDFLLDLASTFVEYEPNIEVPSDDDINETLRPGSTSVTAAAALQRSLLFSPTAPLPPVMTRDSHSPSGSFHYANSNTKYLSYLNQLLAPGSSRRSSVLLEKSHLELQRRQTVLSFTSIIASYENNENDTQTLLVYLRPSSQHILRPSSQHHLRPSSQHNLRPVSQLHLLLSPRHLRLVSLPNNNDHGLPLGAGWVPKSQYSSSSSTNSMMSSGSLFKPEPKTPTFDAGSFAGVTIAEEPDYDFLPLEPKMHREMMWNYKKGHRSSHSDITSDRLQSTQSLGQWEIRPRHPARNTGHV